MDYHCYILQHDSALCACQAFVFCCRAMSEPSLVSGLDSAQAQMFEMLALYWTWQKEDPNVYILEGCSGKHQSTFRRPLIIILWNQQQFRHYIYVYSNMLLMHWLSSLRSIPLCLVLSLPLWTGQSDASNQLYRHKGTIKYRMAGNFGGEYILADWRFWEQFANISSAKNSQCDVIICKIRACVLGLQLDAPV